MFTKVEPEIASEDDIATEVPYDEDAVISEEDAEEIAESVEESNPEELVYTPLQPVVKEAAPIEYNIWSTLGNNDARWGGTIKNFFMKKSARKMTFHAPKIKTAAEEYALEEKQSPLELMKENPTYKVEQDGEIKILSIVMIMIKIAICMD